jgi:6-pyruvoyltetrahydropterin/6-carboxytetrahydropterin synthase
VLKARLGSWIDEHWDHGFLYYSLDVQVKSFFLSELGNQLKSFRCAFNPTAEEMAHYLLYTVGPSQLRDTDVVLFKVELWETENCYAAVEL